jgi:hypothetical protein
MLSNWRCRDCGNRMDVYVEGTPGELSPRAAEHRREISRADGVMFVDTRDMVTPCCPKCGSTYGFDGNFTPPFDRWEAGQVGEERCPCGQPIHVWIAALSGPSESLLEFAEQAAVKAGAVFVEPANPEPTTCPRCGVAWVFPDVTKRTEE